MGTGLRFSPTHVRGETAETAVHSILPGGVRHANRRRKGPKFEDLSPPEEFSKTDDRLRERTMPADSIVATAGGTGVGRHCGRERPGGDKTGWGHKTRWGQVFVSSRHMSARRLPRRRFTRSGCGVRHANRRRKGPKFEDLSPPEEFTARLVRPIQAATTLSRKTFPPLNCSCTGLEPLLYCARGALLHRAIRAGERRPSDAMKNTLSRSRQCWLSSRVIAAERKR